MSIIISYSFFSKCLEFAPSRSEDEDEDDEDQNNDMALAFANRSAIWNDRYGRVTFEISKISKFKFGLR